MQLVYIHIVDRPSRNSSFLCMCFYLDGKGRNLGTEKMSCLSSSFQVLPLDATKSCDSYARTYRELVTLFTLSGSLAEGGLESLIIGSVHRNLTVELY